MKFIKFFIFVISLSAFGQNVKKNVAQYPKPIVFTVQEDHDNMMKQLGIKTLRPGRGFRATAPNQANYDEALANPCPILPDILTLNNGQKVTTPQLWWEKRRPEIMEEFEREVYGRLPQRIPKVQWITKVTDREIVGKTPVIAKHLIGHVDNSEYPLLDVNMNMVVVLPTNVKGPVPVLIMFGTPVLPAPAQPSASDKEKIDAALKAMLMNNNPQLQAIFQKYPAYTLVNAIPENVTPADASISPTEQLLAAGWGYVTLDQETIQEDNGAGLTRGIIGLVNKGQPRKPDDWGVLRAWSWGAARALDYLETDTLVDAKKIGIEGISRYGKAALVTLAFEPRFAVGLIGSAGKGGTALHRRNFGEVLENLTNTNLYHWMAGNYMRYGASESSFGVRTACDLKVDSHESIALCAPRLTFISYGIPEKGDVKWLDQQGSYMAAIAAGTAFKLLKCKDLGVSNDYQTEKMPPVLTGLLDGELAWRQHEGGHTDAPNFQYFIPWATKFLKYNRTPIPAK